MSWLDRLRGGFSKTAERVAENLTGLVTPGDRIRAVASNRIVYRNGVPIAVSGAGPMWRSSAVWQP